MALALIPDRKIFYRDLRKLLGRRSATMYEEDILIPAYSLRHQEFIVNHTLAPYHRAVTTGIAFVDHGDPSYRNQRYPFFRMLKLGACFCPKCAQDDVRARGFSYWRRSHQLLGIDWCYKHKDTPLQMLPSISAFCGQPHRHVDHANPARPYFSVGSDQWKVLKRFADISLGILAIPSPVRRSRATRIVLASATTAGICQEYSRDLSPLVQHAKERLPLEWLQSNFPDLLNSLPNHQNNHGKCRLTRTNEFILAFALLFDSADTALGQWRNCQDSPYVET